MRLNLVPGTTVKPSLRAAAVLGPLANVAVTKWFAVIDRTHEPVPEQSPDHPVKRVFVPAVVVNVTVVPFA
jgi:hypothetical protein